MRKLETVADFILGGSKITAYSDCSHEIKRCLFLGRKAMTNLDSILKSRDITLPTKVRLVKAMVFPVVICGYKESWVSKNWCFWTIELVKTLESSLDCREIKPVYPEGNQYSLGGLMLKLRLQFFALCHKGGVICVSEVINISPGNLDSSLCFSPAFHMMYSACKLNKQYTALTYSFPIWNQSVVPCPVLTAQFYIQF